MGMHGISEEWAEDATRLEIFYLVIYPNTFYERERECSVAIYWSLLLDTKYQDGAIYFPPSLPPHMLLHPEVELLFQSNLETSYQYVQGRAKERSLS